MRYLFFGASVTEQTASHSTGEITGYVTCLETDYTYSLDRISAGSCSIHDAGILLLDDVISKSPDVCFLEWCTSLKIDRDLNVVTYICKSLASHGIAPVPLILPRSDRANRDTELAGDLIRVCRTLGCPTLDLSGSLVEAATSEILRDVVHTTLDGAKFYANRISAFIESEEFVIPSKQELVILSDRLPSQPINISTVEGRNREPLNITARRLRLRLSRPKSSKPDEVVKASIFADVRVGPWTGKVSTVYGSHFEEQVDMFDRWCFRERQCLKKLTPEILFEESTLDLHLVVSEQRPSLQGIPQEHHHAFSPFRPSLKVRGRIYVVSTSPSVSVEVLES